MTPVWKFYKEEWTTKEVEKAYSEINQKDQEYIITWTTEDISGPMGWPMIEDIWEIKYEENGKIHFGVYWCFLWDIFQHFDGRRSQIKWMKSTYEVSKVKKERSSSSRDNVVVHYTVVKRMNSRETNRIQIIVVSLTSCVTLVRVLN